MTHKLLLADDSVTIQRVIELTFADEDVDVTTVGDGQLAIDRLDTERFDIVLADVDMPKRDGYEVAAYVKSRPKLAHIPVVLLTGAFEPVDQARADAAGSSDVLAKPFEPQMVINRVKELLSKKKDEDAHGRFGGPAQVAAQAAPSMPQAAPPRGPAHAAAEPRAQAAAPGAPVSLDDYFDQLDAAFSSLQPSSPAPAPPPNHESPQNSEMDWSSFMEPLPQQPPQPQFAQPAQPQTFAAQPHPVKAVPSAPPYARPAAPSAWPAPPIIPVPVSPPPARPAAAAPIAPAPSPVRTAATIAPWAPAPPVPQTQHHEPPPSAPPAAPAAAVVQPAPPPAPVPAAHPPANPFASLSAVKAELAAAAAARPTAPVITNEVMEEIVTRVLQRLSDRVVRETVAEIVSKTAEQAVREEIERIKSGGE
jgi:CheY-like chemotaxis protein